MPPKNEVEEEDVVDRGDTFDADEFSDLEEDDDGEEFESSLEDEEDEESEEEDEEDSEEDSEDDEEDSEEDEEEDEEDSEEDEEEEVKEERIPKGRFNQVLKQRDKERERVAWLEEQFESLLSGKLVPPAATEKAEPELPAYDFETKEAEYIDLILEGETDKATKLKREIKQAEREQLKLEMETYREEAIKSAKEVQEEDKFQILVESYENKYDFLNVDSDEYNEEAVDTVNAITSNLIRQGISQSKAIKQAVERIVPMYEKPAPKPKSKSTSTREKTSRKRNVTASKSQPPRASGKRADNRDLDTVKVSRLTEKQFRSLSEREKKALRGD